MDKVKGSRLDGGAKKGQAVSSPFVIGEQKV